MKRIAFVIVSALALAACAGGGTGKLPSAPPPGEPAGYAGIDSGQLRVAMGNPAFTRKESAGIEMWRYDGQGCKAFFFLYPKGAALSVQHVETIPRPQDASADISCLNRLRVDQKATS
ncbi:MAG TPA: hypothetical protein VID67_04075 [Rhizomicrobium sp.]|jgi:hypothetical protein